MITALSASMVMSLVGHVAPGPIQPGVALTHVAQQAAQDPSEYFLTSARLFKQGQRDEAVFWFYLGQLRLRAYVKAHPKLDPSGAPALLASFMATMGPPINQYAFGDVPALNRTIDKVLAWDDEHPDPSTPKSRYSAERASVRQGLMALRDTNLAQRDQIRAERTQHGLENRE